MIAQAMPQRAGLPAVEAPPPQAPAEDGYDPVLYLDEFGLGPAELDQPVSFGDYSGTVREMLENKRCPVGGQIANSFESGGWDGVKESLARLAVWGVKIKPSDRTEAFHRGELTRDELLQRGPAGGTADFLA